MSYLHNIAAYVTGPSGAGKTTYVRRNYPRKKYFILHSDKYAIKKPGGVKIDWERGLADGIASGKPIVVDAYHANKDLMAAAKDKILLDPGVVATTGQLIGRRKKSLKREWKLPPEQKLANFAKTRDLAKSLGFKEKVAYTIPGHEELTNRALTKLESKGVQLTQAQKDRLIAANIAVDTESLKGGLISEKHSPFHYHLGEEAKSKKLIKKYFNEAVNSSNTSKALDALGIALHTVQDRQAHHEQGVKPGVMGLVTHIPIVGYDPDSITRYPDKAQKAVSDSVKLLQRYVDSGGPLGKVRPGPAHYTAVLSPEELRKTSAVRSIAVKLLKVG